MMRTFPPELVDEVIARCGRTEQRSRSLPARTMAYFAIGMALHAEGSYEDVLALLCDGLAWASDAEPIKLPSKSGIFQARARLGFEPLEALLAVGVPASPGGGLGRLRHARRDRRGGRRVHGWRSHAGSRVGGPVAAGHGVPSGSWFLWVQAVGTGPGDRCESVVADAFHSTSRPVRGVR